MASSMVLVAKTSNSLNDNHNNNNLLLQVSALPGDLVLICDLSVERLRKRKIRAFNN